MNKTIKDYPSYEELPFLISTTMRSVKGESIRKHENLADMDTGEIITGGHVVTSTFHQIDPSPFTKLYHDGFNNVKELSSAGVRVLLYIMQSNKSNAYKTTDTTSSCFIDVHLDEAMEFCGYKTRRNIYIGIYNLLDHKIVAKRTGSGYWINPNIFFNGNRSGVMNYQAAKPPLRVEKW